MFFLRTPNRLIKQHRRLLSLATTKYPSPTPSPNRAPVLILHGLYGSSQSWRSLSRALSKELERDVIAVDLRNHGASPSSTPVLNQSDEGMRYDVMAADVGELIGKTIDVHSVGENWRKEGVGIIGHSMGGKTAMALALSGKYPISKLCVIDISPAIGPISPAFVTYLDAFDEIVAKKPKSRKEADEIMSKYEKDLGTRQFLLTNLRAPAEGDDAYSLKLPVESLRTALGRGDISSFPYHPIRGSFKEGVPTGDGIDTEGLKSIGFGVEEGFPEGDGSDLKPGRRWLGDTLVLKGAKSKYINRKNIPHFYAMFPRTHLRTLDAGHWVQVEQPKEFVQLTKTFFGN